MDVPAAKRRRVEEEEEDKPAEGDSVPLDFLGLTEESVESFISEVENEEWADSKDEEKSLLLPAELLEVIFAYLPLRELFSSCRLVCQHWNKVVMRDKFLMWRKRYYMFKCGQCSEVSDPLSAEMRELMQGCKEQTGDSNQVMLKRRNSILQAARYVADCLSHVIVGEEAEIDLQQHPQFGCVKRIIEINPQLQPCPVITIFLLTVCCSSVREVWSIAHILLAHRPNFQSPHCTFIGVTEILYCFATVCYALWDMGYFPPRFHYFIFYAMSLLEQGVDHAVAPLEEQQTQQPILRLNRSSEVPLTAEQLQIVNYKIKPGEVVKIVALAGTGKTTTLFRYTTLNSHLKFFYCVYNKSVQTYAKNLFPSNVSSYTFHSLAYRDVGCKYKHKILRGNLNYYFISQWVAIDDPPISSNLSRTEKKESLFRFSKYVLKVLENFVASADSEISLKHQHYEDGEYEPQVLKDGYADAVLHEAARIWKGMADVKNYEMKMPHDGYLKLFQLSRRQITGCDCILVDEAQDLTPAMISILKNQTCSIILVGDPHQQIYSFRGAENAMRLVPFTTTFSLTRSFRFGPEIAYVVSLILDHLKHVKRQTLVGGCQSGGIQGGKDAQQGQMAIIARFNASLFDEMVRVCDRAPANGRRLRIGFAGGIEGYELNLLENIHKLLQGQPTRIMYRTFNTFEELKSHTEQSHDASLKSKVLICERYQGRIPEIVQQLKTMNTRDLEDADIVFSTAHKSKGLEFNTVMMVDDFLHCPFGDYESLPVDEKNVVYVAATRAKKQLILPPTVLTILNRAKEFFVFPSASTEDLSVTSVNCPACELSDCDTPELPLKRLKIETSGSTYEGGQLCTMCCEEALPCFNFSV